MNCSDAHMLEKWLAVCRLDLDMDVHHLHSGGTSNGLKLWAASHAMNLPITVVMEDTILSTSADGPDFLQCMRTFLLASYSTVYNCSQEVLEDAHVVSAVEPICSGKPLIQDHEVTSTTSSDTDHNMVASRHRGHPVIQDETVQACSSAHDTDVDDLMELENVASVRMPTSGQAKPCKCPVCDQQLSSGLALECHLKSQHLISKMYTCPSCDVHFNNPCELSSHQSNVHTQKVSCTQCAYRMVSRAKMRQHV